MSFHWTRPLPRLIGLCGNPMSGKSETQRILRKIAGYEPVDDGYALREFAVKKLGLNWDDVLNQDGKKRYTEILGKNWQNRDILGSLGKALEDTFGEHILPYIANKGLDPAKRYSFGSVRKTQAHFLKAAGAIIIGIRNPLAGPSPYAFDQFDPNVIDVWIDNDGLANSQEPEVARITLEERLITALTRASETV